MGESTADNAHAPEGDASNVAPRANGPSQPEPDALGNTVGRGASWVMLSNGLGKIAALVAQVVLATILTDVDFGVFAMASALGWCVGILKDAGANAILLQRGPEAYDKVAGALFWMNTALATACAVLIAGAGVAMAFIDPDHPQIAWILYIIAFTTPMQIVGAQLQTKLRQDLRFAKYSQIQLISAILRQASTIAFALGGAGALALAWPYVLCALYEGVAAYRATGEKVWKRSPDTKSWAGFFREGWWTLVGTGANFALDQGAYLVMGFTLPKAIVGQFYFAFQLVAQTGVILGYAVQQVLIPALVRLNNYPERQAEASMRALAALTLASALTCAGVSVGIAPLETIFWNGKWAMTVPAVVILGMFFAWRVQYGLTTALLHAQGRFKRHAWFTLFEGGGVMVVTLIATLLPRAFTSIPQPDVTVLAWWVGAWLLIGRLVVSLLVFRFMDVPARRVLNATVWSWLFAVAAGLATLACDHFLDLDGRLRSIASHVVGSLGLAHPKPWMTEIPAQACRLAILSAACTALFMLVVRAFQRETLAETLLIVPVRFRGLAARMLGISEAPRQVNPE